MKKSLTAEDTCDELDYVNLACTASASCLNWADADVSTGYSPVIIDSEKSPCANSNATGSDGWL